FFGFVSKVVSHRPGMIEFEIGRTLLQLRQLSSASADTRNKYSRSRNHSQSSRRSSVVCDYWWPCETWEELTNSLVPTPREKISTCGAGYICGVNVPAAALGGRWRTIVLAAIRNGASGFAELRREVPGIPRKCSVPPFVN